jgi:hypothetical protein
MPTPWTRSLWTCPKCGKQYVNPKTWHACGRWTLESHFLVRPDSRRLFEALKTAIERDGPVTVTVSKTRIEFMTRVRFAGCQVRRDYLRASIWLRRRVDSPRMVRIDRLGKSDYIH